MKDHNRLEDIFKDRLFNEEVAAPAHMFERIAAARKQRRRRALWLRFAGLLSLIAFVTGGAYYLLQDEKANSQQSEVARMTDPTLSGSKQQEAIPSSEHPQGTQSPGFADAYHPESGNSVPSDEARTIRKENRMNDQQFIHAQKVSSPVSKVEEIVYENASNDVPFPPKNNDWIENKIPVEPVDKIESVVSKTDNIESVITDAPETKDEAIASENTAPEPIPAQPGKWSVMLNGGAGTMTATYHGSETGKDLLEKSGSYGISPGFQLITQYRLQANWHLEAGLAVTRGNLMQEMSKSTEIRKMEINEQRVTIYDPVLPPYERVIRDTAYGVEQRTTTETGRYQRTLISIPVGFSHTWWSRNWDISTAFGLQFHIAQKHEGTLLDPISGSASVSELLMKQSNTTAYTSLRVSRRINDRWNWIVAPSFAADIRSSEWKNEIRRRDLWWHVNTGLRYQF